MGEWMPMRGYEIKVLDKGYVRLIDWMGSDEDIVAVARMSTGRGFVRWKPYKRCKRCENVSALDLTGCMGVLSPGESRIFCDNTTEFERFPRGDLGILDTMYRNRHSTPFEFGELHIEVQAPIMVFREWHRHRTQSFSEFSARYSQMPDLHYLPDESRVQLQSATNRQGSSTEVHAEAARFLNDVARQQDDVYKAYSAWVRMGLAKEVARLNTPVSRYSKMRAKTDLRNWLGFLLLRMAPAAQWEIRQYAFAVAEMVKAIWPRTYDLFEEYDRCGTHLSKSEAALLRKVMKIGEFAGQGYSLTEEESKVLDGVQKKLGVS